ncbi:hypothetical protein Y1Q_0004061 [Alligator mississippiensis]|uniref:Uncharacterized protein n=1 Tax=Alligator mississippiensis TaxID=8496 RepID=A0A151PI39_ALLMI|nr:hypothetical protein Y1Q_0004061 [Alligator mississippiensis]
MPAKVKKAYRYCKCSRRGTGGNSSLFCLNGGQRNWQALVLEKEAAISPARGNFCLGKGASPGRQHLLLTTDGKGM